jgi:hypothetical protein
MEEISKTKKYLTSRFKMKNLKEVDTILGIKVKKHNRVMLCGNLIILKNFFFLNFNT